MHLVRRFDAASLCDASCPIGFRASTGRRIATSKIAKLRRYFCSLEVSVGYNLLLLASLSPQGARA